jgi:hypothetical protein
MSISQPVHVFAPVVVIEAATLGKVAVEVGQAGEELVVQVAQLSVCAVLCETKQIKLSTRVANERAEQIS